jgi:hypothetical protein
MDKNILENLFVKAVFPMVLGNRYDCSITESFETLEDAEKSDAFGEAMTRDEYAAKAESWNEIAIIPVTE